MRKAAAILIPVLLLAGCENASQQRAKDSVREMLRDPDSAKFKDIFVGPTGAICGSVNARNGFGGMTGFKSFFTDASGAVARIDGEDAILGDTFNRDYSCACFSQSVRDQVDAETGIKRDRCPGDKP